MIEINLTCSPEELNEHNPDVIIIGSGPAGVAVAERLYQQNRNITIGIVERGGVLTLTHINNIFPNELRRAFIDRFKIKPWEGTFRDGGMLIPALGGRGIASGALLRRFDDVDLTLWENGKWPEAVITALPQYYNAAEITRRVSVSAIRGPEQTWALGTLHTLRAYPPPVGIDLWANGGFDAGRGYDSSVSRLWRLLIQDFLTNEKRRIYVATNAYATKIEHKASQVTGLHCINTASSKADNHSLLLHAENIVLAASTIESARLFLNFGLAPDYPAAGCYLAEHIERRTDTNTSVTNEFGQVHGVPNLYVADASLFPCVGIANPMLTITALAYRVADRISKQI